MIFAHFASSLRETFPARASEWALGLMLFNWSVVLSANPDLLTTSATLRPLTDVMDQGMWALLCLVGGAGRLAMLAVNGGWRRSPHLRALSAFLSCLFWFLVSVGIIQSGQVNTGLAIYPILFILDAYNVIRAMGDAGSADRAFRGARNGTDT